VIEAILPPAPARLCLYQALALGGLIVALDQASKHWILFVYDLPSRGSVEILPFLNLTMVWNAGISYGLFKQYDRAGQWLIALVMLIIVVFVLSWLARQPTRIMTVIAGLVTGGAIGNLYDRLTYGAVVDFIHFHAAGYDWYVFNLADTAIVIGGGLMILESLFSAQGSGRRTL